MMTIYDIEISDRMTLNYMNTLVNKFYKILPIKESGENTLCQYLKSLQRELMGFTELAAFVHDDDRYLTLLAILQYFIDHDADVDTVRTDVFRAIGLIKKLQKKYGSDEG